MLLSLYEPYHIPFFLKLLIVIGIFGTPFLIYFGSFWILFGPFLVNHHFNFIGPFFINLGFYYFLATTVPYS